MDLGAKEVFGIDLSYKEIRIAEDIELNKNQGINYLSTDFYIQEFLDNIPKNLIGNIDIVVGYFALDHAMNKKELNFVCKNISKLLKEKGVFLGMGDKFESFNHDFVKYGVYLSFDNYNINKEEGKPRRVSIFQDNKEVTHFHNFLWKENSIRESLLSANFRDIIIKDVPISRNGLDKFLENFWKDYLDNPDQIFIEAIK